MNQPLSGTALTWLWVTIFLGGAITYCIRLSFILLFSRLVIPAWLKEALRYIPPAVLAAIIFSEIIMYQGHIVINLGNARLIAGLVAVLVAWRTKNAILTIIIGMAVLWILQAILI